jgi:branched-chain amino acid aminotransferase
MSKFLIYINGEFFDETTAKISVFDRGFLYGDSVYEATRTYERAPFQLGEHIERLMLSAQKIELTPTLSKEQIVKAIHQTIAASPHENISLRIILTRGTNADLGLDPNLCEQNNLIIMTKAIHPNPESWTKSGVAMIFAQKLSTQKGPLPKTGNYQDNILAYKLALSRGAFDAIMINNDGHVTEGTTSNIWIIKDKTIYTPALIDGVLPGLTRQTLLKMAVHNKLPLNLKLIEKSLTRKDFEKADECFLTSTTRNLVPVTRLEGHPVGNGLPGIGTLSLLKSYLAFVSTARGEEN